jgi:hypothetical protein
VQTLPWAARSARSQVSCADPAAQLIVVQLELELRTMMCQAPTS